MIRAWIYARKSPSESDEQAGVDIQKALCLAEIERRGWSHAGTIEDVAQSAYEAQFRPGYERLLTLIQEGEVQTVVTRHNDRLHRDVSEYKAFERLVRKHKVQVVPVLGGDWAAETAQGRFSGTMLAAVAEYESSLKAERINQTLRKRAERGLPANTRFRSFGFEADGVTQRPAEAQLIRKGAKDLLSGRRSLTQVSKEWGKTLQGTKKILTNPRMIGMRAFQGSQFPAQWKPILDLDTYHALKIMLEARSTPPKPRRWILSGLARCGVCDALLRIGQESRSKEAVYRCPDSHVVRRASRLEDHVRDVVLDMATTQGKRPVVHAEDAQALAEIRMLEGRLEELALRMADPNFPLETAISADRLIRGRLEELRAQVVQAIRPALPKSADNLWNQSLREWHTWWEDPKRTLTDKRALILSQVDRILVHPTAKGRLPLAHEDVQVLPVGWQERG